MPNDTFATVSNKTRCRRRRQRQRRSTYKIRRGRRQHSRAWAGAAITRRLLSHQGRGRTEPTYRLLCLPACMDYMTLRSPCRRICLQLTTLVMYAGRAATKKEIKQKWLQNCREFRHVMQHQQRARPESSWQLCGKVLLETPKMHKQVQVATVTTVRKGEAVKNSKKKL